ncbi:hypothetical protein G7Z17_g5683 [Cylindrodendrum hubeiense]|uniref:SnoaL-like domain-containing protein n=1 Tax=Cylindrodendrum hubeiense TaxID=595255 RepID=A0A9P5HBE3_9HYPO|nr:hypothetical protein G7Z17_g5683 [Cylindrodendrum hubeiense]
MSKTGSSCAWPKGTSIKKQELFERFYRLLDGNDPEESKAWSETFTLNGELVAFGQTYKGRAGMLQIMCTAKVII